MSLKGAIGHPGGPLHSAGSDPRRGDGRDPACAGAGTASGTASEVYGGSPSGSRIALPRPVSTSCRAATVVVEEPLRVSKLVSDSSAPVIRWVKVPTFVLDYYGVRGRTLKSLFIDKYGGSHITVWVETNQVGGILDVGFLGEGPRIQRGDASRGPWNWPKECNDLIKSARFPWFKRGCT